MCYNVHSRSVIRWLADAESLACNLLGVRSVNLRELFLQCCAVETLRKNSCVSDDICADFQFLNSLLGEFRFQFVLDGLDHCFKFILHRFKFLQFCDLCGKFVVRHCDNLFHIIYFVFLSERPALVATCSFGTSLFPSVLLSLDYT